MHFKSATNIISAVFILLFVYTALNKLIEINNFQNVLAKSPLLHRHAIKLSWIIPVAELIISILLFVPSTKSYGLYAAALLMFIFTGYIAYMLKFASELPCSCGGILSSLSWKQHLIFNILFCLLALIGIKTSRKTHPHYHNPVTK